MAKPTVKPKAMALSKQKQGKPAQDSGANKRAKNLNF